MTLPARPALDAIVVGAGPNGLAAAVTLARAGRSVRVYEAAPTIGGGLRTEELTLPGFRHDVCATVVPLALASPFFRTIPWAARGVEFVQPSAPLGHALDDRRAVLVERSIAATAAGIDAIGRAGDGAAWQRLFGALARESEDLAEEVLRPVIHVPRHPLVLARFGLPALFPATVLARLAFRGGAARALFAGIAAHGMVALDRPLTASFGLVLGTSAHAVGWPMVRGGSAALAAALADELRGHGGEIVTNEPVGDVDRLPPARTVFLDTTPRAAIDIAGARLPRRTLRAYERFRYGAGVFKVDWALAGPVPWTAPELRRAGTVHLGGTYAEIVRCERDVAAGRVPAHPFTLFAQYHPWDPTRAPDGRTTAWAYCHVPAGCDVDMTERIEAQVERFAPGFRDLILARATHSPADLEAHDPNHVGGDINAGVSDVRQILFRPTRSLDPYHAGNGIYLCSSSTPPGGGAHGMSGYLAARSALRRDLR